MGGEVERYGKSNMETYTAYVKQTADGNLPYGSASSNRGSVSTERGGMGREMGGNLKREGICIPMAESC